MEILTSCGLEDGSPGAPWVKVGGQGALVLYPAEIVATRISGIQNLLMPIGTTHGFD